MRAMHGRRSSASAGHSARRVGARREETGVNLNRKSEVWIDAVQRPDRIDRYIVVHQLHADYLINTKQARRWAYLSR
jgi:hypothetical protein